VLSKNLSIHWELSTFMECIFITKLSFIFFGQKSGRLFMLNSVCFFTKLVIWQWLSVKNYKSNTISSLLNLCICLKPLQSKYTVIDLQQRLVSIKCNSRNNDNSRWTVSIVTALAYTMLDNSTATNGNW